MNDGIGTMPRFTRRGLLKTAGASIVMRSSFGGSAPGAESHEEYSWLRLDDQLKNWWDRNLMYADETALRADPTKTLRFLPSSYVRISEANGLYPQMFPDDANYLNMALISHERLDLVRNHLDNYLFSIERFGYMPNANANWASTRSSAHFLPVTLLRYIEETHDARFLWRAFGAQKQPSE